MAKFYGIGVGPGDSELVTVKASRLLEDLDILYTPEAKKGSKSFALGIAEPYLKEHLEIKAAAFPLWSVPIRPKKSSGRPSLLKSQRM